MAMKVMSEARLKITGLFSYVIYALSQICLSFHPLNSLMNENLRGLI